MTKEANVHSAISCFSSRFSAIVGFLGFFLGVY